MGMWLKVDGQSKFLAVDGICSLFLPVCLQMTVTEHRTTDSASTSSMQGTGEMGSSQRKSVEKLYHFCVAFAAGASIFFDLENLSASHTELYPNGNRHRPFENDTQQLA